MVQFTYNTDAIPHLTGVTSALGQRYNYTLGYWVNTNLVSPVPPHNSHGQAHLL